MLLDKTLCSVRIYSGKKEESICNYQTPKTKTQKTKLLRTKHFERYKRCTRHINNNVNIHLFVQI